MAALLPAPATAATDGALCGTAVVSDAAGVVDDPGAIERAAEAVGDDTVVKVLTFREVPGDGDLFDAVEELRTECGGWGFDATDDDASLLVLAVATDDRELGSLYDGARRDAFDGDRDEAEEAMGASFADGRWSEGLVAGLEAYQDSRPAGPWLLLAPVGGVAAVGAGVGGVVLVRRRRRAEAARQRLTAAAGTMATTWDELDEGQELVDARVAALPRVQDRAVGELTTEHARLAAERTAATETYLRLSEHATPAWIAGLSAQEADAATSEVTRTTEQLAQGLAGTAALSARLDELDVLREQLPVRAQALRDAASDLEALAATRRDEGWRTDDVTAAPAQARHQADVADDLAREQRVGDAGDVLVAAEAALREAHDWLGGLPRYREGLLADLATARQRAAGLAPRVAAAYATTDRLERDFDPSDTAGVRQAVDAAAVTAAEVARALDGVERDAAMEVQRLREAREALGAAETAVAEAEAATTAPDEREARLVRLRTELPQAATALADRTRRLQAEREQHAGAIMSLTSTSEADVQQLEAAAAELGTAVGERAPLLDLEQRRATLEAQVAEHEQSIAAAVAAHEEQRRAEEQRRRASTRRRTAAGVGTSRRWGSRSSSRRSGGGSRRRRSGGGSSRRRSGGRSRKF